MLSSDTQLQVTNARVALASLKRAAPQLPNPQLLRGPTLRREAQSTSALEGTYAPLEAVFASDEDFEPSDKNLREVMNYVASANFAFNAVSDGIPLSVNLLENLQARLVSGTQAENPHGGKIRDIQVMIGAHAGARVEEARRVDYYDSLTLHLETLFSGRKKLKRT